MMGGKSSPLVLITSNYKTMTKSEQKVADFITAHTEETVYLTVTDLAEKAHVGETTVIRFCRKLGFRGYQEFKLAIAQNLVSPVEPVSGEIQEDDSLEQIAGKITQHNAKTLKDSLELLGMENVQRALRAIKEADKISFFGIGSSGITAQDAEYRFMRMGFNVKQTSDAHVMAMHAALAGDKDVVVGISSSGSTKDVVDAIRIAKENNAFVICLTNHARSPVTQYADVILLAASRETPLQGGAYSSKIAQLHLLDILTKVIELQQREKATLAIQETAKAVLDKLY